MLFPLVIFVCLSDMYSRTLNKLKHLSASLIFALNLRITFSISSSMTLSFVPTATASDHLVPLPPFFPMTQNSYPVSVFSGTQNAISSYYPREYNRFCPCCLSLVITFPSAISSYCSLLPPPVERELLPSQRSSAGRAPRPPGRALL